MNRYYLIHDIFVHCIDCAAKGISTVFVDVYESIIIAVVNAI